MKTIVACVLGLAALVISLASVGPVHADALEAESSALPIFAPGPDPNGVESLDKLHCVLYSDGVDNCIVNVQLEAVDQGVTAAGEIDPSPAERAPTVNFVDAIRVVVVQTLTITVPGFESGDHEDTANTGVMPAPATEPASDLDAKTTTGTLFPSAGQSADAIVVAIVQSTTVAVPGQIATDGEQSTEAESISDPKAPTSISQAKTTALHYAE